VTDKARMPEDWDDHHGWETFYAANASRDGKGNEGRFAQELDQLGLRRVWFPGCGMSRGPGLFAALGFDALATDVSPTAVRWQEQISRTGLPRGELTTLLEEHELTIPRSTTGSLTAAIHDHRQPLSSSKFDVVINSKAIQGLPEPSLRTAAVAHFIALRPGGHAIFDTMNVQGSGRELLEAALEDAGFFVPLRRSWKWYREALDSTGLEYVFVLGRPRIPAIGEYASSSKRKRAEARLAAFSAEFERRANEEWSTTSARTSDGTSRVAHLVYGTG
jgi:SAM-dependent methyltransferase